MVCISALCSGDRAAAVLSFILGLYLKGMTSTGQLKIWSALKYYNKNHSYGSILNDTSTLCCKITAQVKERKITEACLENVSFPTDAFPQATINTGLTQVHVLTF